MAGVDNDRFRCDGRGLDYWLWELVCDDIERRDVAAHIITRMHSALPTDPGELARLDGATHLEEFSAAVRRTLDTPDFATRRFLEELIDFLETAQAVRMRLWEQDNQRQDRVLDKLTKRLGPQPKPEDLVTPRVRKVLCSSCDPKNKSVQSQEMLCRQQVAAGLVFAALREQVLLVPERVLTLLRDNDQCWHATSALERIGPAGRFFAAELLRQLDATAPASSFPAPAALASIIRDDAPYVREVTERLGAQKGGVAMGAADTLGFLGRTAARLVPGCVPALLTMSDSADPTRRAAASAALGHITAATDVAVDRLLTLSHDTEEWVQGIALTALGHIARQPTRVVPRLIEAFDDYHEGDPDWTYQSAHERVVNALQAFGEDAATAVPALSARVRNAEGDLDRYR